MPRTVWLHGMQRLRRVGVAHPNVAGVVGRDVEHGPVFDDDVFLHVTLFVKRYLFSRKLHETAVIKRREVSFVRGRVVRNTDYVENGIRQYGFIGTVVILPHVIFVNEKALVVERKSFRGTQ